MKCRICKSDVRESVDHITLCRHKGGAVHLGCCRDICSWDREPCKHSSGVYKKV